MSISRKIRSLFGAQDMTVGSPMSCLLKFSIPLLIGNIAQQLYNTVDAIVIGQSRWGDTGLAAVGLAGPIVNLLLVLFMGISTGASILSAQYFGARDRATLNRTVGASLFLIFVSGLVMMAAGYFLSPALISLTNPPEETVVVTAGSMTPEGYGYTISTSAVGSGIADLVNADENTRIGGMAATSAVARGAFAQHFMATEPIDPDVAAVSVAEGATDYLQIFFLGIIGCGMYNIISGILRGLGDSIMPLLFLVVGCMLNICLDLAFVSEMGVAGVALATIIAQGVSALLCLWRLCTLKKVCDVEMRSVIRPDTHLMKKIGALGLPAGITQAIFSTSAIVVQTLTNSLGKVMIAANTAVMRVDGFAMMPNFTFGTAATTYMGQNVGAGRGDRLKPGLKAMMILALTSSIILVGCIVLFGHNLIGFFTETELTIQLGMQGLQTLAVGYICFAVTQVLQGTMRGAGETQVPMWISIISTVALRLPLAYGLAFLTRTAGADSPWPNGKPSAIFVSLLVSWVVAMVLSIIAYQMKWWRRRLPGDLGSHL